jgi:GntR family transcriptional regulator, transcriptional repressor for pyruvate dehydrogenase complex
MAEFGVGRTTIREAIRSLASAGILDIRQGDGTYVNSVAVEQSRLRERLTRAHVPEVFEVRRALELEIAGLAALRRADADVAEMREAAVRMQRALQSADRDVFVDADVAFHMAMARATGNELFAHLYQSLAAALRQAVKEVLELPGRPEACLARHVRFIEAVERSDAGAARAIRAEYLDETAGFLGEVFGPLHTTTAT